MIKKRLFNDNWFFKLDDSEWCPVEMPHDWLIYDTENLYKNGIGQYRKELNISCADIKDKRLFLRFDGVYMDSAVSVNGKQAFEWKYGYSAQGNRMKK